MQTEEEFQSIITDQHFPKVLLKEKGAEDRLRTDFFNHPVQFTRTILSAYSSYAKWDAPQAAELMKKLNITKGDVIRWS